MPCQGIHKAHVHSSGASWVGIPNKASSAWNACVGAWHGDSRPGHAAACSACIAASGRRASLLKLILLGFFFLVSSSSRNRWPNASPSGLLGHRSHSHALVSHKCKAQATTADAVQQGITGNLLQDPPQGKRGRQAPRRPPSIRGFETFIRVQAILYYPGFETLSREQLTLQVPPPRQGALSSHQGLGPPH